jgi:hypothetical protein
MKKSSSLGYWYPILLEMGVNTPQTIAIDTNKYDPNCEKALRKVFWMEELSEEDKRSIGSFMATMKQLGRRIGYPLFLRTGHTSYKHEWLDTCYVQNEEVLPQHIQNIAEHGFMANMQGGWPANIWVLRRLIETEPIFKAFNGFPVTKEFRVFIRDGKLECIHPYWPEESIKSHTDDPDWRMKLKTMNKLSNHDTDEIVKMSNAIAQKFEGWWSLDWLKGKDGKWYAIDMAIGEDSYHFPGCKFSKK